MNKVQVIIRIRPIFKDEAKEGERKGWSKIGDRAIIQHLNAEGSEVSAQAMFYDWVFSETSTNQEVFAYLADSIVEALGQTNVCIIAYGQTSSGKTHTMRGTLSGGTFTDPGVIPNALKSLFAFKDSQILSLSFIEVYNEQIFDLLGNPLENLQIREMSTGETYIQDAQDIEVATEAEALELLKRGNTARKIASTRMNKESSRSHTVLKVKIKHKGRHTALTLVDLAGSERIKETHTQGGTLKEGAHINKSLLALTTVISKLSQKHTHIPFRNAKLTRILQPSLTENSKTILICAVSPTQKSTEETLSTLNLANRAKNIEVKAAAKLPSKPAQRIAKLLNSLKDTQAMLSTARQDISDIKCIMNTLQNEVELSNHTSPSPSTLSAILSELQDTKSNHLHKLSKLSENISYLLKQEKAISSTLSTLTTQSTPPAVTSLLQQLIDSDALIEKQRRKISTLTKFTENHSTQNSQNITLAIEMDRIKKDHQREKRILQLKIAQLQSQLPEHKS